MPAPTFVADYQSVFSSATTPKTATPTTAAGDRLVVFGATEDAFASTLATPTGNSLTYTLAQSITTNTFAGNYQWTATDAAGGTGWTLSVARNAGSGYFGIGALRFSGSNGFGASSSTTGTGTASLGLTTTQANSAIVVVIGDWNAADGTSRTWLTVNGTAPTAGNGYERLYFRDSSRYTVYAAYYPDAGAAGAKTVGLSAPTGEQFSITAVEVLGTAAAAAAPRPPVVAPSLAAVQASNW